MPGWSCYVQGRLDPVDFFYGLQLSFDEAPHLATLRREIEEAVIASGLLPGGSEYTVGDVEILDFRLNVWVNLESRGQMYSGCHLAAIRDTVSGTSAGPFEVPQKPLEAKLLGFALEAQRIFDTLDADCEGVLRMRAVLKALRHDVSYAIDVFTRLDVRATGAVTFQDFLNVFNSSSKEYLLELRDRLQHGGRAPSQVGASSGHVRDGFDHDTRVTRDQSMVEHVEASLLATSGLGGLHTPELGRSVRRGTDTPHEETPRMNLLQLTGVQSKPKGADAEPSSPKGSPRERADDPAPQGAAAKQVVDLLQKSIMRKREQVGREPSPATPHQTSSTSPRGDANREGPSALSTTVVSKLKGLRKGRMDSGPGIPAAPSSAASNAGSASSTPVGFKRKASG